MKRQTATAVLAAAVGSIFLGPPARGDLVADQTPFHSYRGWWVDRFDYSNATDIRTMMNRAQQLGITDVMFQVRGQADAYYWLNDNVEVRASGISSTYDPLGIAIAEGHSRGIKVHAWMNAMPIWRGTTPPTNSQHLYNQHPEYRIKNASGADHPLNSSYVTGNPTHPGFQSHLNDVVRTIATNYDVDGIHLDYIRLTDNSGAGGTLQYPADAETIARFQQEYPGQTPSSNNANFRTWVAGQITNIVGSIRQTTKAARPDAQLTASVWRSATIGLNDYQQDWGRWVREGLLDAAMPMIYHGTGHTSDFYTPNVTEALSHGGNAGVIIGLGTYQQDDPATAYANTIYQLTHARNQGANGVQLFDYKELYSGSAQDNEVLRAITDFFNANRNAPAAANVADFEAGEGTFKHNVTVSTSNQNVSGGSADRVTSEKRTGTGSQRIVISKTAGASSYLLRHVSGDPTAGDYNSNPNFASIGTIGFWLKTTSPDVQVAIALDDTSTGDRSYFMNVIADGEWHKYEWFLNDVSHWDPWVGGDGKIATRFAIDSVHFTGTADTTTIFMDDVFQDAAAVARNQWTFDGNNDWGNAANWTGGVPNGVGAAANLLRRATTGAKLTLTNPVTLGALNFDNAQQYHVAGPGTLTMDQLVGTPAGITVTNRGSHRISAPLTFNDTLQVSVDRGATLDLSGAIQNGAGRTIHKTGEGALTIRGTQTHGANAALQVARGTVNLESDGGANLAVAVSGVASNLNIRANQRLKSITVGAGAAAKLEGAASRVVVNDLTIENGGLMDLSSGSLVVHSDAPDSDLSGLTALVRSARAGGWTGFGLTSSAAKTNPLTTLAVVRNLAQDGATPLMQAFFGEALTTDSLLVTYTWAGDLNADGVVDFSDYGIADHGYANGLSGYGNGDVNVDGVINVDDFHLMDRAFLRQDRRLAGYAAPGTAAVPEPSAMVCLLALGGGLLRRRTRNGV